MQKIQLKLITTILLSGLMFNPLLAANKEPLFTGQQQQQILAQLSKLLRKHYVIPDNAERYINAIERAIKNNEFSSTNSVQDFISQGNQLIQATISDKHLVILTTEKFRKVMEMFHPGKNKEGLTEHKASVSNETTQQSSVIPAEKAHIAHAPSAHGSAPARKFSHSTSAVGRSLAEIGIGRVAEISRDGLNQTGYIEILRFDSSPRSQRFIERIFSTFTESDAIIIDLRLCGGGDADMVKTISNYFFDKPTHLLTSSMGPDDNGNLELRERWTKPNRLSDKFANKPLKILISKKSFSAAESFAFGMQSVGRAEIVGETSGGGGYMNDFYELPFSLGASISVGRAYDPRTGNDWQGIGVEPNLKIASEIALITALEDYTIESGKLAKIAADEDKFEIYKTLQSYSNAWYSGDSETMNAVLKDTYQGIYSVSSGKITNTITKKQRLAQTVKGDGKQKNRIYNNRIIENIRLTGDLATVTLILRESLHKIHLEKTGDDWLISEEVIRGKVQHG